MIQAFDDWWQASRYPLTKDRPHHRLPPPDGFRRNFQSLKNLLQFPATPITVVPLRFRHILEKRNRAPVFPATFLQPRTLTNTMPAFIDLASPSKKLPFLHIPLVNFHMQGLKVLIVEDDGDLRGLYCFLLANEGCQVRAVRNGLEAITEIEANRPDIVVTDIAMPVFGGLDLIKAIRADDDLADLPVLAMTNFAEHFHERALEVGADKAIGKPNEVEILREAIQSVLLRSQT